ncbi:MAG: peptide-methionine (S)-S-oxide reductase MsrA [Dehalococcoidia bacterium]|jgi:peptide-methionine (S)-S-oxide reductase
MSEKTETAIFGGGCFWCTETVFFELKGVISIIPGYAGGTVPKPSYMQVCGGGTGHAEIIKIEFDPDVISFDDLLEVFFHVHDPTTLNRQGNDTGEQYRSIIFYHDQQQKEAAEKYIGKLTASGEFNHPIVTQVRPLTEFYEAEGYHQRYYAGNAGQPYCQMIIAPKMAKFRAKFKDSLKTS